MKADIYYDGKIYKDVEEAFMESFAGWATLADFISYPVQGSHNFTDGMDVTGRYELEHQVDQFEFWNRSTKYEYDRTKDDLRRIVAIPTPLPVKSDDKEAKEKARELVEKFKPATFSNGLNNIRAAKQCALIACDLLIAENTEIENMVGKGFNLNYWQQVHHQIQSM